MPNIPVAHIAMVLRAVLAFVAVLGVATVSGVTVVEFPSNYLNDPTLSPLSPLSQPLAVELGSNLGSASCPTCLFTDLDDNMLDYYGRPIDVEKLLDETPTPTLPLKISFAAPSKFRLKPTPAPPENTEAVPSPEPTTTASASPDLFNTTTLLPGTSIIHTLVMYPQGLFLCIGQIVETMCFTILRARRRQPLSIACAIISSIGLTASVLSVRSLVGFYFTASVLSVRSLLAFYFTASVRSVRSLLAFYFTAPVRSVRSLLAFCYTASVRSVRYLLNLWKSCWTKGKASDENSSSQANARLAMRANCLLEKVSEIVHGKPFDRNRMMSAIESTLVECVKDEEARLIDKAAIRNKEILENEKRKINRIANKTFKTLRKAHKEKLIENYERDVLATANIEPSFGTSLRNAETEVRHQLQPFRITEEIRENLTQIFKTILYSFAYAIAVQESLSGTRLTRYLSVIDGQNSLLEALRLLLKHREEAFAENESLVRLLCRYDKNGKVIIPDGATTPNPFDWYSPRDDKFILSPLDGPAALSMKVSLSSAGFQSCPDALLISDPHWQEFKESMDRKGHEQEVRHASAESVPMEDQVQVNHDVEDGSSHNSPQSGEDRGHGIKDASERNHHDDEIAAAPHRPHDTHSQQSENSGDLNKDEVNDEKGIKDVAEQDQSGAVPNGESILDRSHGTKPMFSRDFLKHKGQYHTGRDVSDLKWQIRYLNSGYGTPDDPWAKPYSDAAPPVSSEGLTGDEALAREIWMEELAIWRKERILGFEKELSEQENENLGNGDSKGQSDACTDSSIQPINAEHQPKEPLETTEEGGPDAAQSEDSDSPSRPLDESDVSKGESPFHQNCGAKLILSSDGKKLIVAIRALSFVQWQMLYLRAGHGTEEDHLAKHVQDDDAAKTLEEKDMASWRKDRIFSYKRQAAKLQKTIESLRAGHGTVTEASGDTGSDNGNVSNRDSQSQSDPCTDVSTQPLQAEHKPKKPSKSEKRRNERNRAKAKGANNTLNPNDEA